jgi:uncharacterized protein (TIGR02001 family)
LNLNLPEFSDMKPIRRTLINITNILLLITIATSVRAQEWDIGIDFVSSFIWRGMKIGSGPAIQPVIEYTIGNFTVGSWGSCNLSEDEALETDIYSSFQFDINENSFLELLLTDYYYPGTSFFESSSHFIEPMLSIGIGNFCLKGAYMINNGTGDIYTEAGITAGNVNLLLGAGDGMYTANGRFNLCNISIGTSKNLQICDTFSLPVSGSVVLNPSSEQLYIVAGISF